ncbi:MAG: hypothetical protein ACTHXC_00395 [Brachybacterium sp.]
MPRRERQQKPRAIVAAAKDYSSGRSKANSPQRGTPGEDWQHAGWDFFDLIPEYHQGCAITGALLSRASLVVMERDDDGTWNPTQNASAKAALDELGGGEEGHSEMLRQLGIHLSVAGEGWLVNTNTNESDPDNWLVVASTELRRNGNQWKVGSTTLSGEPLVIRIWKRHPRDPQRSDAPTRAILPVLSELNQLTKRIAAQIDSRLAGAGLLLVPSETTFPATPKSVENPGDPAQTADSVEAGDAQGLADLLFDTAQRAVENPESAAAMLPIIGEAPGEYIGNIKHLTFWSELDRTAPKLREELIRRIALGLDMPPEVLLGNSGSNHWNAWLSDENSVKVHAEPLLKVLTSSLTTGYLRPSIEGEVEDPKRFAIVADTSQMRLRPNRSKESIELNEHLLLSDEAVLRENGFTDTDKMPEEDLRRALLRKVASGSTTPELVEAALRKEGVDLGVRVTDNRGPAEARPTPSIADHPTRELPTEQDATSKSEVLTFVSEQIIDRALQRAGNRIKSKMGLKDPETPANRLYLQVALSNGDINDILKDAWSGCQEFDYGVDPSRLARVLDVYTRSLIASKRRPTREGIAKALRLLDSSKES